MGFVLSRLLRLAALSVFAHAACGDGSSSEPPASPVRLSATVYGDGEAAGYLRLLPEGEPLVEWAPRDVIVVRDAPLDVSIVAALLSAGPQSGASHLTLRLKEKSIPNASVPTIYSSAQLAQWNGKLVYLRAEKGAIEISLITLAEAERVWS
ncbi:MAG TPA: hypothetical protein VGF45_00215, partial [Polyangia bacterium]